jgi:uncharacterized protein (TIGR02246 family)
MEARTPADVDRIFGERVNAGDVDGIVALYEPGATLVTQDAGTLVGHAAIREYMAILPTLKPRMDMGTIHVVQMTDDLALAHHDWHCGLVMPDGSASSLSGKATEVMRRQANGSWRFLLDDPHMRG